MAFRGKVALVVGGGSGMGQVSARKLAAQGATVALFDRDGEGMAQTALAPGEFHCFEGDLLDGKRVGEVLLEISQSLGPIDRLTITAAIMPTGLLIEESLEHQMKVMRINYEGNMRFIHGVLPQMLERGCGDVIVYGSVSAIALTPHMGAYGASKAALHTALEILIEETRPTPVRIHLTCPPMVDTPLINQALETSNPNSIQQAVKDGLLASPEAIVDEVEAALEAGQGISYPGKFGKGLYWARRFAPRLLWKIIRRSEKL